MNKHRLALPLVACGALLLSAVVTAQDAPAPQGEASGLESLAAKVSYALGYRIAVAFGEEVDLEVFRRGFADGLAKKDAALSQAEMMQSLQQFQRQRGERLAAENLEKGRAFLAANKEKEGVHTTPSGLQYKVLKEGTGPSPTATDRVTVHYHGTLIDGTVFDSSVERGKPATFPLNGVIRGWTEGLQLMKVGGKTIFYLPAELAYG
ncbi:MAG: FKBP-type peptidyl-prolyl cis-trans isomerase, partial [Planctomycetota bacterium]